MEMFSFEKDFKNLDERSVFANRICKLLYDKHNGDLDKAIIEGELIFKDLEEFVRNIYELVYKEIPLYAYYNLIKYGAANWCFDENGFKDNIAITQTACRFYYVV